MISRDRLRAANKVAIKAFKRVYEASPQNVYKTEWWFHRNWMVEKFNFYFYDYTKEDMQRDLGKMRSTKGYGTYHDYSWDEWSHKCKIDRIMPLDDMKGEDFEDE